MSFTRLAKNLITGFKPRSIDLETITHNQFIRIMRRLWDADLKLNVNYTQLPEPDFDKKGESGEFKSCYTTEVYAFLMEKLNEYPISEIHRQIFVNQRKGRERHYIAIYLSRLGAPGLKEIPSFVSEIQYEAPVIK